VLFYLPEHLAATVLRTAARHAAAGSRLACDLIGTGIFRFPYTQDYLRSLVDAGTPWLFGTDDPERFLAGCGWQVDRIQEPGNDQVGYGRWPQTPTSPELPDLPRSYLITATKTP
jgi:O-methyltransferase involved in polyketide biosynthesis